MALQIHLLGSFAFTVDDAPSQTAARTRVQDLIAWLILHCSAPSPRHLVAAALWPEVRDEQALKNLRTLLTRLRDENPELASQLLVDAESLGWRGAPACKVDLLDFERMRAEGLSALEAGDMPAALRAFAEALLHYGGDLLPGHNDEWIRRERERLHRAWIDTLDQRARLLSTSGAHVQAQEAARQLLHVDPLHESAYASLMRSQLALGDRAGALRTYHACAALLREEIGVDPGAEVQSVYREVLFADQVEVGALPAPLQWVVSPGRESPFEEESVIAGAPLIGRADELEWLKECWQAAGHGMPHVALVSGEAGIGKTRLAAEFALWVERTGGGECAFARCYAGVGTTTFAPIADWLRSVAVSRRTRTRDTSSRAEAARLTPELFLEDPTLAPPKPMTQSWQGRAFSRALAGAILGDGEAGLPPLLLVLEDVQWADTETLAWLPVLLDVSERQPLLVLATLRIEEGSDNGALTRLLHLLRRSGQLRETLLSPLDGAQSAALAASLTGEVQDTEVAQRLFRDTEGNPLFIVEMVRAGLNRIYGIDESPSAQSERPLDLPPAMLAALRYRFDQLTQSARDLAECAAVLGRDFRYDHLEAASHMDEETVVRGLDELWHRRIVREQGALAYDFSHDKLRAVTYEGLSQARRRLLHRRAAEALVQVEGDTTEASTQIALHFERAVDLPNALLHFQNAARAANTVYAAGEAAELHRKILGPDFSAMLSASERIHHLMALGEILNFDNRGIEAEALYQQAIVLANQEAEPLLSARAQAGLGTSYFVQGKHDIALDTLQSAQAYFESCGSLADVVRVLESIQTIYLEQGHFALSMAALEAGLETAEAIGDKVSMANALSKLADLAGNRNMHTQFNEYVQRLMAVSESIGYRTGIAAGHFWQALQRENLVDVVQEMAVAAREAREVGDRNSLQGSISFLCYSLTMRGDPLRGVTGFLQGIAYNVAAESWFNACSVLFWGNYVIHLGGWLDLAERVYQVNTQATRKIGALRLLYIQQLLYAVLLVDMGKIDEAEAQLADARSRGILEASVMWYGFDFECLPFLLDARIAAARGDAQPLRFDEAREIAVKSRDILLIAECAYWSWKYSGDEDRASIATQDLRAAYDVLGDTRLRLRYQEITCEMLPDPPSLPDLSDLIPPALSESEMHAQIHALLEELAAAE